MKSLIAIAAILFGFASMSNAQFKKGEVELSLSGSLGSMTNKYTTTSTGGKWSNSESNNYLFVSVMPGYYLVDGLSVEPEIGFLAVQHSEPAEYFLFNLSYTYLIPDTREALYARAGYGIANSVEMPYFSGAIGKFSDKLNVGVINLGGGVKFLLTNSVALRTELNYRTHTWSNSVDYGYGSYSSDQTMSNFGLLIGFSILL